MNPLHHKQFYQKSKIKILFQCNLLIYFIYTIRSNNNILIATKLPWEDVLGSVDDFIAGFGGFESAFVFIFNLIFVCLCASLILIVY